MATTDKQNQIQRIEKQIQRIHKKIEKEKQNLINSGFEEDSGEFEEIFYEIVQAYESEMFPLVLECHKLEPYEGERRRLLEDTYDIRFDDLPEGEEMTKLVAEHRKKAFPKRDLPRS
jgi:DNA replicative helicase MCM subunit Mcm2 (Cdc46/Mcm family)